MFSLAVDHGIALPQRSQTVVIDEVRHLSSLQMKVFAVKGRGDLNLNPMDADDYKRLKPLLTELRDASVSHAFTGQHADYEVFSDSLTLAALPVGVYMLEFTSQPSTRTIRRMYYVTDVFAMAEEQPDGRTRYVVVSATTGQPIAKARLRIKEYISWKNYKTHNLVADAKGECFLEETEGRRREVFAYTATDDASPEMNLSTRYNYYEGHQQVEQTCLYTDRAIYRPGQTVRVSALVYEVRHGFEHATLENRTVTFSLRDANYKEVQTQRAQTDKYGTCAVSFTLPASGLTGQFTIRANGQSCSFRVEEYKRPTFEVSFDEVKQHYEAGDTVEAKAVARSYAGVPVQGAKVSYKVMRRMAFWWWSYSRYWDLGLLGNTSSDEVVASGETTTADDGSFTVAMPLTMPESRHPLFYNFVVTADVTDQAGETRTGSYSLPLGNRKTAFSVDLGEKILAEGDATMTFHLRNAAGNDLDAEVRYRFDAGQWQTAATTSHLIPEQSSPIPADAPTRSLSRGLSPLTSHLSPLNSGSHSLEAICGEDTLKRDFIVFSLDDKRPAAKTDDWFWVSDTQFPCDGKPVTVQVGSSAPDVHIVYSIFSGQKCIEQGAVDRSNELINRKLKYKEEWGDGILLTFAWVKENRCYTHQTTIRRPLPDKQLKLTWNTFRDRLTPGQQEEWTLTVMGPDGKPADAQLMAVLYDKSLDQLVSHNWLMIPYTSLSLPYASWAAAVRSSLSLSAVADWKYMTVPTYHFSHFDESVYPTAYSYATRGFRGRNALGARALAKHAVVESAMAMAEPALMNDEVLGYGVMKAKETVAEADAEESASGGDTGAEPVVQLRENLNETAFFYPQLMTDANGVIALKFTLPESLTTWRFMGLAHTTDLCHGMLSGETVAKKDVMIQPNVPRFVRQGDEAVVSARIFNTSDHAVSGKAMLRLLDPETEAVVYETSQLFSVAVDGTASVAFNCNLIPEQSSPIPADAPTRSLSRGLSPLTSHLSPLNSGSHSLEAICGEDTLKRDFIVFSLDDKRPAAKTDDWFWVSDTQFPCDGKPVTVQVGSSAPDVHIVYSIFSGQKCIEQGAVDRSNELINRKLKYKEEWGDGILLTFAWVKENRCYTHQTTIRRPLPDKQLKLTWNTFRDRLTPGQQEEWTLTVMGPDGKPADAQLMAVLYDKSLDQLVSHNWLMIPYTSLSLPYASWAAAVRSSLSLSAVADWKYMTVPTYHFSHFDESVYPTAYSYATRGFRGRNALGARALAKHAVVESAMAMAEPALMNDEVLGYGVMKAKETVAEADAEESASGGDTGAEPVVQLRENLNETAFFYPQLMTDANGVIALKFTLPESLTTWRFMGLAHTTDLCHGMLSGETVAKKDVMIQPNVPRFVRQGDEAVVSARIFNTSDHAVSGKAMLRLLDPETEAVVYEISQPFSVAVDGTASVAFNCNLSPLTSHPLPLLICQVLATGDGFSDGEQHYLPILPNTEHVTVTLPFTQIEPGTKTIDLAALLPEGSTQQKLTVEYTNHPAWLMIQALPALGTPSDENAISQAASLYANSLGRHIISQAPDAKKAFELWKQEETSSNPIPEQSSPTRSLSSHSRAELAYPLPFTSNLSKNQELKDLLLAETPWVLDAERETEQKQRLADFFDDNTMQQRLSSAIEKLKKLQQSNGAWTWWPGMPGSFYITVAVSEMLVRLNAMAGQQDETAQMLTKAFDYMGLEMVEEVNQMKRNAKKGIHPTFPSFKALQWLYLSTLDGRRLPSSVEEANKYLLNLLKKDIKRQTMYEKAMTAVILAKSPLLADADRQRAREYVQSLKEYTVYREEMGRYYDTPRAGYSWYDYKIPTQTMAIEALQRITPDDRQTIQEMQRWLLQSKRTQAWDTPINSVNAVYAFLNGNGRSLGLDAPLADIKVDGRSLDAPKATAAIGYVKAPVSAESKTLTIEKTADDTSWGAVYAQFMQPARDIQDTGAGLTVKREYLTSEGGSQFSILNSCVPAVAKATGRRDSGNGEQSSSAQFSTLSVGSRLKVRITITADRDYDFVQLIDRRAACLEPVSQLSGYHDGSYCTPRDNATNYYFDRLSKGTHVIETEYYIDRPGTYETGSCSVSCAYAPEFRGITSSQTINVK